MVIDPLLNQSILIEVEVGDVRVFSVRDFFVPGVGDLVTIPTSKPYAVIVKRRHWVVDKRQSMRSTEFRCVLECEKHK